VQCTLTSRNGEDIPGLPKPKPRTDQFASEVAAKQEKALGKMDAMCAAIDEMKISQKQKDALKKQLGGVRQELVSNTPYVLEMFGEHMEATVQKAKIEINAYGTHMLIKTGIAALNNPEAAQQLLGYDQKEGSV
jgi:hypothetical protein